MQEIKLFNTEEEVNTYLGITPIAEPDLTWVLPENRKAIVAINKLFNIHKAHNQANNFAADWSDDDQYKYSVWKWIEANSEKLSGFGFSGAGYGGWCASSGVGSRLSVGTSKEVMHIGITFEYLYEDLFFFEK
jgi:hypothetical protein